MRSINFGENNHENLEKELEKSQIEAMLGLFSMCMVSKVGKMRLYSEEEAEDSIPVSGIP